LLLRQQGTRRCLPRRVKFRSQSYRNRVVGLPLFLVALVAINGCVTAFDYYERHTAIQVFDGPREPRWDETLGLEARFRELPPRCALKISSPKSALALRAALISIAGNARSMTSPCQILDDEGDSKGEVSDVDAPSTPVAAPGITIRWKEDNAAGKQFRAEMESIGSLIVHAPGHKIPESYPPDTIWIEIGNGSPWKDQNFMNSSRGTNSN
jgi:hypothetical protein